MSMILLRTFGRTFYMETIDNKRKVVLLKGDENKWYEQAIFILRSSVNETEIDFVKEAERIINSHSLQNQIANKYGQMAGHTPMAALAAPTQAPPPLPAVQKNNSRPRPKTRLDFILNAALITTGIALVSLLIFNFL